MLYFRALQEMKRPERPDYLESLVSLSPWLTVEMPPQESELRRLVYSTRITHAPNQEVVFLSRAPVVAFVFPPNQISRSQAHATGDPVSAGWGEREG